MSINIFFLSTIYNLKMIFPANLPFLHHHYYHHHHNNNMNCVYSHHQQKLSDTLPDIVRDAQLKIGPTSCTCQSNTESLYQSSSSSSSSSSSCFSSLSSPPPLCSYPPSTNNDNIQSPEEIILQDVGQWLRELSDSLDEIKVQRKRKLTRLTNFIVIIISIISTC